MYNLIYLPAARQDMVDIVRYVSRVLENPIAAERLAETLIEAGERIAAFPYANPAHRPIRLLKREYRKLLVQNYLMLYWVDEENQCVTVARVVYAKRNYTRLLE